MLRKVAIALVAASMLAAPVLAQAPAANDTKPATAAPSTTTDKSAPSTTVKTNKAKSNRHSRAAHKTHIVAHKPVKSVKHARHFNPAKSHKLAGTAAKVVSAKSATRSSVN